MIGMRVWGIVLAGAVAPSTAWAAMPGPEVQPVALAAIGAVGLVAIAVWVWRRQRAAQNEIIRLETKLDRLERVLTVMPGGFVAWTGSGETWSSGLASWLGATDGAVAFNDLAAIFRPDDFARLNADLDRLRHEAVPFNLEAGLNGGRVIGAIGSAAPGIALVSFHDASFDLEDRRRRADRLANITAERDSYRAVLDAAPFPIWWRGDDLGLAGCNQTYARMVEAAPDAVARDGMELASALDPNQAKKLAAQARDTGATASDTRRFVVAGDRRVYRIHETPLATDGITGYGQDITPEEDLRGELSRHVAAHAEVLQNLSTAIAIYGPDKRLILFNHAYAGLWELDRAWLAALPHFSEVLEKLREARQLPEQADWQAYKRAQLALFNTVLEPSEEMLHLPDGRTIRLTINPHPFGGLLQTYEDVSDRLALERARNTLIAVQRATLDNLYEGIVVYGSDGRVDLYNAAFRKLWNLPDELLAAEAHINEVIEASRPLLDDGSDWQGVKERALQAFIERSASAGRLDRPDGSVVDYSAVPLPDGALLFTYLDVTDSTRIERALRERNEALQAADQLKSEFVANVSYELRTPLNTIIGFSEILANQYFGPLNPRQTEYGQGIIESSHQLLMLINDILDLASIEAGHMVLEPEVFDLRVALDAIAPLVRERARRQNLTIEFDCPPDIGAIEADERRIKQVMFNLLSNALKFTPQGGRITLRARRLTDEIVLSVSDTGIGIPESDRHLVFEKFRKSRAGARHPGAGLGLALVRSFIELHGGRVEIESALDEGTMVACHLPLRLAAAPSAEASIVQD